MRNKCKKVLAVLTAVAVLIMIMPQMSGFMRVYGEVTEVSSLAQLSEAIARCNGGEDVEIKLGADITGVNSQISITGGQMTINLNGYTISGSMGRFLINATNDKLVIMDDKSGGGIINTNAYGGVIQKTKGVLNISGGEFKGGKESIFVSGSEVEITGGVFSSTATENGVALRTDSGSNIHIQGETTEFSSYDTTIWMQDGSGSTLTIDGGTFIQNQNDTFGYTCYLTGKNTLNINGGTFILNTSAGKSLFIGTGTDVSITGGAYSGGIGVAVSDDDNMNYSAFYGDENGNNRILAEGCVLTDNTMELGKGNIVSTVRLVSVVKGSLIKMNTRRSTIEEYDDEQIAKTTDIYSITPVSVGEDGNVYKNSDSNVTPQLDETLIADGNKYLFNGWYDSEGKQYDSVDTYIKSQGTALKDTNLSANWNVEANTAYGLKRALENNLAVKSIKVTDNIVLSSRVEVSKPETLMERTMDMGDKTIQYSGSDSNAPALILNGLWKIENGTIISEKQPCMQINGAAFMEKVNCIAQDASYAVELNSNTGSSQSTIISGMFETTLANGCALRVSGEDINNLFKNSYASNTNTKAEGSYACLTTPKLMVSRIPITYIGNGTDVDMGTYTYGDDVSDVSQLISNQKYMGDIVVTGISSDNDVFIVSGESAGKSLLGGSADTYSYTIKARDKSNVGVHKGTIRISYVKMDGSLGIYEQAVTLTVKPKEITLAEPSVTKTKIYDGTMNTGVSLGVPEGIINGDDVSVKAVAEYDNADAGTNKNITVRYILSGKDKDNYLAPADINYTDGVINQAEGMASVTMSDYYVGKIALPSAESQTNGTEMVTYYYKKKGATDDAYSTVMPDEEGSYTLKAVFAATKNYREVVATTDFKVSYIDIPENAYSLVGTKGNNGWYTTDVTVYPAKGYSISNEQDGIYKSFYTLSSTSEPVIYLKNDDGAVTRAIQMEKILIDKEPPKCGGIVDDEIYYNDEFRIIISDDNLEQVTLNGENISFQGNSLQLMLKPSAIKYVVSASDKAGNIVEHRFKVEEAWMKEGIIFSGIKKLIQQKEYKLGTGQWKVSGDSTVYNGGRNFYVPVDGEYEFQKQ